MGDDEASVPTSEPTQANPGDESAKAGELEPALGYGWNVEIDETDFGESDALDDGSAVNDNSPDPAPLVEPAADTPPAPLEPPAPVAPPIPAAPVAQAPPTQPPPAAPKPPAYALPHDDSPVVREWTAHLLNTPVEQRQQLLATAPGDVGGKVAERLMGLQKAMSRFQNDPHGFIGELAEQRAADLMEKSVFADRFRRLEALVLGKAGEEFLTKHKIVAPQERAEFDGLVRRFGSAEAAVEHMTLRRRLAELEGTSQRVRAKEQTIDATKASARAQQSGKGRGRATDLAAERQKELNAAGTDVLKIASINEKYEKQGLPAGRLKQPNSK